jgi:ABC-type multidrug transport system ATPase subunit
MDEIILKTEGLSKRFRGFQAVNQLNLDLYKGDIYGFLGLNGAGKTTTIRMLLGLINPSGGKISFYGKEFFSARLEILKSVSALVEIPIFYSYLSGLDNLKLLARVGGINASKEYLNMILEYSGLASRAKDKVKAYSQGMRQRLGIAQALLGQIPTNGVKKKYPPLIILDEPTNGLDPQGIVDMRNLIKRINKEYQITFLISSHLLSEIELLCNRVGIIKKGSLVAQGLINNLMADSKRGNVKIKVLEFDNALDVLGSLNWVKVTDVNKPENEIIVKCDANMAGDLNRQLVNNKITVAEITTAKKLEEYFISLM